LAASWRVSFFTHPFHSFPPEIALRDNGVLDEIEETPDPFVVMSTGFMII
jgi:hypothetical protein